VSPLHRWASVAALILLLLLIPGCDAGDHDPAASVEEIARRLGPGRDSSRFPTLCPDHSYRPAVLPPGTPNFRAVLGSETNPVPVRFHVLGAPARASELAHRFRQAAESCSLTLEESAAGGTVSSATEVTNYAVDGWNGVSTVVTGTRGDDTGPSFPFTDVSVVASRGVVLAEVRWVFDDYGSNDEPDPDWISDGRREVADLLRKVGGDPESDPPQVPDRASPTYTAARSLPPPESYGEGTIPDPPAEFLASQPCGLGSQLHYPPVDRGYARTSRMLAGPEGHVEEVLAVLPSRNGAEEYFDGRVEGIEKFSPMPKSCFGLGHPLQLPIVGATVVPYVEHRLEIGRWEGTIGSAAARLQGAPAGATIANSQVWTAAVLRNGDMVASVTLFARARGDLNGSIAEKEQQVEQVLRGMVTAG
jgi:hypothetical protein